MENTKLEEYKLLREDKNHLDSLSWQILYFYFAIAPLFLLVGAELGNRSYQGALLASIIFDVGLGLTTAYALLAQRRSWIDVITQAKEIEKKQKLGIKHFSEYESRIEKSGLGLEKIKENKQRYNFKIIESRFIVKLIFILLFLAALLSIGTYLYLPNEVTITKIIIAFLVFIFVFIVLLILCFYKEYQRIKALKTK
ncbi:MAG TPA: hypothetical protein VMW67_03640 [Desulfobacteria bacterium]|nr:hypothetical protein [Desulfobacteria bacterium]